MKTKIVFLLMAAVLLITGCQKDEEIEITDPMLKPVSDLKYEFFANNDSIKLSWNNPNTPAGVSTIIRHTNGITVLGGAQSSANFGIIETNKDYVYTVKVKSTAENVYSLGSTVRFVREGAYNVSDITFRQEEDSVIINWKLPQGGALGNILISWKSDVANGTKTLGGGESQLKLVGLPLAAYQFAFVTKDAQGKSSHTSYQPFRVGPTKVGFLSKYPNASSIIDDDEIAAAQWFFKTYSNSAFISFNDVKNGSVDLKQFRVIWWQSDELGGKDLPAIAKDPAVVQAMADYHKQGGNLFLTTFATYYLQTIGRLPKEKFAESNNYGDGAGGVNPDVWAVSVNLKSFNYATHPLYRDLIINNTGNNGKEIPLIGAGWKEDHNCNWGGIPAMQGFANDDDAFVPYMLNTYGFINLGSWGHVRDYWQGGIVETTAFGSFKGSAIAIGLGAYEWNQNNGVNPYQSQIEKMTKNAIEYLKTK
ncbi:MAG TPA: DUF4960 domain-containing protein [Prolixibacteraceae bacterium]|nr:DUF4960 domain-containing protein [Prolixibacteraceae bacterium]